MSHLLVFSGIGRLFTSTEAGTIPEAVVAVRDGLIVFAGPRSRFDPNVVLSPGEEVEDVNVSGALMTAGFVDAHSHPLYAGNRFAEIALRSKGTSYSEIAAAGGGIASTVQATRAASRRDLEVATHALLRAWLGGGTTTVEAKTGYVLDAQGEVQAVEILAGLASEPDLPSVEVTWLAAHGIGPEFAGDGDGYIESVALSCPDARRAGARHADVFCDEGYFSVAQSRRVLVAASRAGLIPRIHADEIARTGGSKLAAELTCASADHLLRIDESDAIALARAGVVATLAPVTALAIGEAPPVGLLRRAGVTIALGSDHNPGTCGTTSMSLVVALAVAELGLSVDDALRAATFGGATSLRLADRGQVAGGLRADLVTWDADHEGAFAWSYGLAPSGVWKAGKRLIG